MASDKKLCYVITPYGRKHVGWGRYVDFDKVYTSIIERSREFIKGHDLEFRRSKDEKKTGGITEEFINNILRAEVAIIDVSYGNANVFYELGLRHAFKDRTSVIIARKNAKLPFDIKDMRVLFYDHKSEEGQLKAARDIADYIEKALNSNIADSPVHKMVPDYRVVLKKKPCPTKLTYEYQVRGAPGKQIGIKAGDLREIQDVDVWVNAENTDMEMARTCDCSVSALIRFYGSIRGSDGRIRQDLIQDYLNDQVDRSRGVVPATVIVTGPGELGLKGVKKLLHVAVFRGVPGRGYEPIDDLDGCVTSTLESLQGLKTQDKEPQDLTSVLFPVFGIGKGKSDRSEVLYELVSAACRYAKHNPKSVENVYFQAYTEDELRLCKDVMKTHGELENLGEAPPAAVANKHLPTQVESNVPEFMNTLKSLKSEAKEARSSGEMKDAIKLLRRGMDEGMNALAADSGNVELAEEVADCIGMLGGCLSREGHISDSHRVYQAGRGIEMNVPGVKLTYNTVNLMVTQLLDDGWDALRYSGPDINKVTKRLNAKLKNGGGELWTLADLGMCEFLREDFKAAETAYRMASDLADDGSRRSMLGKLKEIAERWPEDEGPRTMFYETVEGILSGQ